MLKQDLSCLPKSVSDAKKVGSRVYYTGKVCANGHDTYRYTAGRVCSKCVKDKVSRSATSGGNARRWAAKSSEQREELRNKRRAYYQKTKAARLAEKRKSYELLKKDPAWVLARRKKAANLRKVNGRAPEKANPEVKRRYKNTPRGRANANAQHAKRHAAKMQRTPVWLTGDEFWMLEEAYSLAQMRTRAFGFSWHVDHVLPLQGACVSGLHTPYNVQVIPWLDNVKKANRMPA